MLQSGIIKTKSIGEVPVHLVIPVLKPENLNGLRCKTWLSNCKNFIILLTLSH